MKIQVKAIVLALGTAGLITSMSPALADKIDPPTLVPSAAQSVAPGVYTTTYPVEVKLTGGTASTLQFKYNSDGTWTTPTGWTYAGNLNNDANTALFNTVAPDGTKYGIALSSQGSTQFVPGQKDAVVTPPSRGLDVVNKPVTNTVLTGFGASTATGKIDGRGATTATLVGAPASVQVIGLNPGGQPVGEAKVLDALVSVTPTSATATPGYAVGSVKVNSNQPNQSIGWGEYTVTVPKTPTPTGTTTVAATVAGSSGSVGANGIFINQISGAGTYNVDTGQIVATPAEKAVFSVDTSGNTKVGGTLAVTGATTTNGVTNNGNLVNTGTVGTGSLAVLGNSLLNGDLNVAGKSYTSGLANTGAMSTNTLNVLGATTTNGITNFGQIGTASLVVLNDSVLNGKLNVAGQTATSGLVNTGAMSTTTLTVTGATTTNGLTNVGAATTTTLGVTGNATIGGNASVGGTLGVTGATTLGGATQINNTLNVTGASTLGGSGTSGNQLTVGVNGVLMSAGATSGNSVGVNSTGAQINGGGAALVLAGNRATFGATNGGAPIRVTGIADGQNQYDAVNYGQVQELEKNLSRGISGATAMANIPQVDQNKAFNLGIAVGGYNGETAVAIGGSARVAKDGILKASVGFAGGGSSNTTWGVGGGWSW